MICLILTTEPRLLRIGEAVRTVDGLAGTGVGMTEAGAGELCLAVVRSATARPQVVAGRLASLLRGADSVVVRADSVVAAFAGDQATATRAMERIRQSQPGLGLAAELVSDRHADFPVLRHALGDDEPAARPAVPSSVDPARPATAVIVDNHPDVRTMLGQLVSRAGWTAVTVDTADTVSVPHHAVELCRTTGADVLVADYHLGGGVSGIDVALACRRSGLGLPVVVFTSSGWDTTTEDAERVGAIMIISKSQVDELLSVMDRLAERLRRAHRRGQ